MTKQEQLNEIKNTKDPNLGQVEWLIKELELAWKTNAHRESESVLLYTLIEHGVDNWEGYPDAVRSLREY